MIDIGAVLATAKNWFGSQAAELHAGRPGDVITMDRGVEYAVANNGSFRRVGKQRGPAIDKKLKHGKNKGTIVPFAKCGGFQRHQWSAYGGFCLRCGKERPEMPSLNGKRAA